MWICLNAQYGTHKTCLWCSLHSMLNVVVVTSVRIGYWNLSGQTGHFTHLTQNVARHIFDRGTSRTPQQRCTGDPPVAPLADNNLLPSPADIFFPPQLETHRRNKSRKLDLDYRWISSDWCFTSHWDTNRSEHSVGRWLDDNSGYLYSRWNAYGLQMCCFFSVRQGHLCLLTAHQLTNLFFIRTVFTYDEKIILKMKYSRDLCKFRGSFLRFVDAHQVQGGMRTSVE